MIAFVGLSGDYNPLYTDAEHARAGPYGEPVAPGTLVAAAVTGLGAIDVPVPATVGMVGMTWRFMRPVRPGDTIRSKWRLNRKRPVENLRWGLAVWQVEVENQRGETVATAEMTRLISRREQPAEPARPGKSRRRRRRAAAEAAANHELPPKPIPGSLVEPIIRSPAEPQPPSPEAETGVTELAGESPSRRRRRSGGQPKPEVPVEHVVTETASPPSTDSGEMHPSGRVEGPQPEPAAPPQGASPPSRRKRRSRAQAGINDGSLPRREAEHGQLAFLPRAAGTPLAPEPAGNPEQVPTPAPVHEPESNDPSAGGLGGVFRLLRRG